MVSINFLTFFMSLGLVVGFLVSLGLLNLLVGALFTYLGRPRLEILKSSLGKRGFAFLVDVGGRDDDTNFDSINLRLFNPRGEPTRLDVLKQFPKQKKSFYLDLDLGPEMELLPYAKGMNKAQMSLIISSSTLGETLELKMTGKKFLKLWKNAKRSIDDLKAEEAKEELKQSAPKEVQKVAEPLGKRMSYGIINRDTVADTVPGKGAHLKIITNPVFAKQLGTMSAPGAGGQEGAAGEAKEEVPNFSVTKVWIAEGCIVCNACEDIYPEVFDVQTDTCYIRPNAPLDDGLRIEEAAEACPVEVIKYDKA